MATKKRAEAVTKTSPKKAAKRTSTAKHQSDKLMEALRDFVRTRGARYLKDPNISSVGIGYKMKNGKRTNEIAVQFTVAEKAKPDVLEALGTEPIPESFTIGGVEVPTDVIQRTFSAEYRVVSEAATRQRKKRINPIVPGVSVSNILGTAGTIGCIVYDGANGAPYILSNWHVLHGPEGSIGDDVVQPGPHDDNRTHLNRLGKLARSHLGRAGDCAVATIEDRKFRSEIIDLNIVVDQLGEPELGDKVVKSGRTTAVTHGIVTRIHTIAKIDYGGDVGEQEIGGFEIGVDPQKKPSGSEVSMGGDSGSVWLFKSTKGKPTAVLAGLHFAGEGSGDPNEHAVACYPKAIFEKLEISLTPPAVVVAPAGAGFSKEFLSVRIDLPKLSASNKVKAFKLNGSEIVDYTHFSLTLNKVRKFPFWVSWNVDGGGIRKLSRKNVPFILDPRIPEDFQTGDELYAGNRLDRGHIARRADLLWGSQAEAKKANKDSFFFTNIMPQMDDFNQSSRGGLWGRLEDAVFADTDVENLKVSVCGGPVFRDDDREFREALLPREFWKVIAFVEGGTLKAKAFLLTQNLDELEALELDEFKVFQVAVTEIESRAGLTFPAVLRSADSVGERLLRRPEALSERQPLRSLGDIDWS
ncbi:MAG: DNA/RNA non-specific endonuclease [Bryobacteraceae bacterium]